MARDNAAGRDGIITYYRGSLKLADTTLSLDLSMVSSLDPSTSC